MTPRLTLNYGMRYERFGAPQNTGAAKDVLVKLGTGSDFTPRLASATLSRPASAIRHIYGADNGDWAPRFGFSWDPRVRAKTLLRGGFGMFYDRPFDNLWQNVRNNDWLQPTLRLFRRASPTICSRSLLSCLRLQQQCRPQFSRADSDGSQSAQRLCADGFLGVQQSVGENLTVEVNGTRHRRAGG